MRRHKTVALGILAPLTFLVFARQFLVWLDLRQYFIALPLGPQEIVIAPVVKVAHGPPEASLERRPHQDRVVSPPNVVLVRRERRSRELQVKAVRLVYFHKEFAIVLLFKLKVALLVFGVGKVL